MTTTSPADSDRDESVAFAWLPTACAMLAMVVGVMVLAHWIIHAGVLAALAPRLARMKLNTALCCFLAGLSLYLQARGRAQGTRLVVARAAATLVLVVTILTVIEYASGRSLIDELLVADPNERLGAPGRMSPMTAVGFACMGGALLLFDLPGLFWISQSLSTLGGFMGLLALVGYALGAEALYGISDFTQIAVQTAVTLVLLAAGQLAARRDRGLPAVMASDTVAGLMARRLVPAALIVPTVVGWLTLHAHQRGWLSQEASVAAAVLITIVMFLLVVAGSARSLYTLDRERGRIDRDLRASEAKFRAVAESAREAIISADAAGAITYLNPGAAQMFGYSTDEAVGRPLALLMPAQFPDTPRSGVPRVDTTGKRQVMGRTVELAGLRRGGDEFPVEMSLTTWGGEAQPRFTAIIRDISERKRAERARRQLASIVECSADAIYSTALDGTIMSWNRAAERIFGYPAAEIVGQPASVLVPQARAREGSGIHERVALGERVDLPETTRVARDGRVIEVWLTVSPVEDDSGAVVGASAIVRDLTERNQATRERDRFFTVSLDMLCVIDAGGQLRRVNPAFQRTLGYAESDLIGTPFLALVHPDESAAITRQLAELRPDAPTTRFSCRFRGKDGGYRWLDWVCSADPDGQLYAAARDVSEQRRAEQRIRDALVEKEVLLKEIHHRVKNNLQIISSLLNFQSRQLTDPKALAAFRESQDRVRSMALFHEKLYQAKDLAHIELADYLRQMATMLLHTYGLPGARIALNVRAEGVQIGVDTAVPCGLIANELITNSLKYAFPAGREGKIDIELRPAPEGGFVLAVADDGVGIGADIDILKGKSLGLQLVHALVEQLNGRIRLERGRGTRFEVTVPAAALATAGARGVSAS